MENATQTAGVSKGALWTGRIISGVIVLFLVFDGVTKVMKESHVLTAAAHLGYTAASMVPIGATLLVCTLLYVIPRTSILGAILLTAYLGGAVATHVRVGDPMFERCFAITFGVLVWGGLYLRDKSVRALIPLRSQ